MTEQELSAAVAPDADFRLDGWSGAELARATGLPVVELHARLGSTLDRLHSLAAAGATAGTVVVADEQTAGRGRAGRQWVSEAGAGLWLSLLERPLDPDAVDVLAIRLGLAAADSLAPWAGGDVRLKWPNDLYLGGRKLAGILVEARWRGTRPDWVAIGFGLNFRTPAGAPEAAGLLPGARRVDVLRALLPALRDAAAVVGPLRPEELAAWGGRDLARGRRCMGPLEGQVLGISPRGELAVDTRDGIALARTGSLVLDADA